MQVSDRERAHIEMVAAGRKQEMLAKKDEEERAVLLAEAKQTDAAQLKEAMALLAELGRCFEIMRADVARLTADNECLVVEVRQPP